MKPALLIFVLAVVVSPTSSVGVIPPSHAGPLRNFDRRADLPIPGISTTDREQARGTLPREFSDVRVDSDSVTRSPKWISSRTRFLTGPDGEGHTVRPATASAFAKGDRHRGVKAFLNEHRAVFGHGAEALIGARITREDASPSGLRTVVWQQFIDDIPVFDGVLKAGLTKRGELVNIGSQFVAAPQRSGQRRFTARRAVVLAANEVGVEVSEAAVKPQDDPQGAQFRQNFRAPGLFQPRVQLTWLPLDESRMRLCWSVILTNQKRGEMFRVVIDAETGEAMVRHCLTEYISDASYRVFTSDSPTPMSPGLATPSTIQPAVVPRTLVTTPALNTTASPNGWIDDGVNETRGNNVDAHLDINSDNEADTPRPQGSPHRVFDFPLDLSQPPSAYRDAAVTQLFYWCNVIHDRYYELGFTEAAGNFQIDNFGKGGLGGDPVQADAQDGSGSNNANFSTPPDGSPARMQMHVFSGPTPDRDGDLDQEIVIHEYTHGLSNRLVGGGIGINAEQTRGMGEGWSDFYALCLLSEAGDDLDGNYAAGAYVTKDRVANHPNYYFGTRRYPYSTDLTKNPLTFKDIDPSQAAAHPGVPLSPRFSASNADPDEVHAQGEVWCVTLWEVRANLIRKHGFPNGNNLILQLVTDGMKLAPANPNFLQARDAIIQADLVANGGANKDELWAGFAKRGMGASASAPSSSTTVGVVESFDPLGDLAVSPNETFATAGSPGGPFSPASKNYTITNTGAMPMDWSATVTQPWLTVAPGSGTLAPNASTTVTLSLTQTAGNLVFGEYADVVTFADAADVSPPPTRAVALSIRAPAPSPHAGWPKPSTNGFTSIADLDNDGKQEVVTVAGLTVQVYRENAGSVAGWPQSIANATVGPPSIADLNGDGSKEIALVCNASGNRAGNIYLWRSDGTIPPGWPKSFTSGNPFISYTISPGIADIDSDGQLDIIYTSNTAAFGGSAIVNIAKMDGTPVAGWPVTINGSGGPVLASPAVADFDGDGQLDIAVVTFGNKVYVYRRDGLLFPGFPVTLGSGGNLNGAVAFADVNHDGQLDLIATEYSGETAIYNVAGQLFTGWPKDLGFIPRPPAIADLDGDGDLEIAFGTQSSTVQVLHHDGSNFPGWPKILPNRVYSPAIADLDDDGILDLAAVDGNCNVYGWKRDGTSLASVGFPFTMFGTNGGGPPQFADLDGNGTIEILAYGTKLEIRDLSSRYNPARAPWSVMHRNSLSISRYAPAPILSEASPNAISSGMTTQVVLTGDHFLKGMKVMIGGVPQPVIAQTATSITVNVSGLTALGPKDLTLGNANFETVTFSNFVRVIYPPDTDADGLPDYWETLYGFNTTDGVGVNGPHGDPDGDGCSNLLEYATGENPLTVSAPPAAPAFVKNPADGKTYLTWRYRRLRNPGALKYFVECSEDLSSWHTDANWVEQAGAIVSNDDGITEVVTMRVLPAVGTPGAVTRQIRLRVVVP